MREYDSFSGILMLDSIFFTALLRKPSWARRPCMMLFLRSQVFENWSFWLLWFWPPGDAWGRLVLGTHCPGPPLLDSLLSWPFWLIQYSISKRLQTRPMPLVQLASLSYQQRTTRARDSFWDPDFEGSIFSSEIA